MAFFDLKINYKNNSNALIFSHYWFVYASFALCIFFVLQKIFFPYAWHAYKNKAIFYFSGIFFNRKVLKEKVRLFGLEFFLWKWIRKFYYEMRLTFGLNDSHIHSKKKFYSVGQDIKINNTLKLFFSPWYRKIGALGSSYFKSIFS